MSDRKFDSVIVFSAKGHTIPEAFFKKLEAEGYTTCASRAMAANGEIKLEIVPEKVEVEELVELALDGKDSEVLYHFGKYPADFNKDDDPQPHIVLRDDKAKPLMLAFLQGDFSEWANEKDEKKRSDEFFAAQTQLVDKIGKLYARNEENIDDLVKDILSPKTTAALASLFESGSIVFLTHKGQTPWVSSERGHNLMEWGWITNNFPYKEITTTQDQGGAVRQRKFKVASAAAAPSVPDTPAASDKEKPAPEELKQEFKDKIAANPPTDQEIKDKAPKSDTRIPSVTTVIKIEIPKNYSQSQRKKFIQAKRRAAGIPNWKDLFKGWTTADYVEVPDNKSLESLKTLQSQATDENKEIEQPEPESRVLDTVEETPVMAKETVETLIQDFLPGVKDVMISIDNKEVFDPAQLRGLESEIPTFVEAIGLRSVKETYNWPYEALLFIAETDPKAIALDAFDLRSHCIVLEKEIADLKAKQGQPEQKGEYETGKPARKFRLAKSA